MAEEGNGIDANKVIDNLANQISSLTKETAIMEARMDYMQEIITSQEQLIKEYEDQE